MPINDFIYIYILHYLYSLNLVDCTWQLLKRREAFWVFFFFFLEGAPNYYNIATVLVILNMYYSLINYDVANCYYLIPTLLFTLPHVSAALLSVMIFISIWYSLNLFIKLHEVKRKTKKKGKKFQAKLIMQQT